VIELGSIEVRSPSWLPIALVVLGLVSLLIVDRLHRRKVPGQLYVLSSGPEPEGHSTTVRLGRKRGRFHLGEATLELRRRWRTVQVRWVQGGSDETVITLRCPQGHERSLRRRGPWESLHHEDRLEAGEAVMQYLAPGVSRHCPVLADLTAVGFSTPSSERKDDSFSPFFEEA
jgi:hypothetical protein